MAGYGDEIQYADCFLKLPTDGTGNRTTTGLGEGWSFGDERLRGGAEGVAVLKDDKGCSGGKASSRRKLVDETRRRH